MQLREVKDDGEIELLKKASKASIDAQRVMMRVGQARRDRTRRRRHNDAAWMEHGCERASYAPIVGSGINSTTLHYSANDRTMEDGDICWSMRPASTRCTPRTSRAPCP